MLALYRSGRQAEASDVYQRTRRRLADELAMEPGPGLQKLLKQILNQDPGLNVAPRLVDAESGRSNLPAQLTRFVGRDREIGEVKDLLTRSRLVTLTGAGGIGKTRLAIEVAGQLLNDYRDGVWLVDLAPVSDQDLVPKTVMYTLGLRIQGEGLDVEILTTYLKGRQQLLLLDNCEHLIEAAASVVATLLRACPDLGIMTTSREPLGVSGESTWRVPPLSTPNPSIQQPVQALREYQAIALFCECASRALGTFVLTDANASGVTGICHRLDGIPLAIELAASRLKLLSVNELDERLTYSFRILKGGSRTAGPRHQTLQATISWSYELLEASEQAMFLRLSVFASSFAVSAAEAVYGADQTDADVFDLVARLVDKSLVVPAATVRGQSRLRLLEVLRQFGHDRLLASDEAATIQDRHAEYFTDLAEEWGPKLRGPEQGVGLDRLEVERDNIRAALGWSFATGRGDLALRLIAAAWLFWYLRGYGAEGLRWTNEALSQFNSPHPSRGEVLIGSSHLAWQQLDLPTAKQRAAEGLALFEQLHDSGGRGIALLCLGNCGLFEGSRADVQRTYADALILLRSSDNHWGASIILNNLGVMATQAGRYADAERYLGESLELGLRMGDPWRKAMALGNLGDLYVERGLLVRAAEVLEQLFVLQSDTHSIFGLPFDLEVCSRLAVALAQWECALRLAGAADSVRRRFASPRPSEPYTQDGVEEARRVLEPNVAKAMWQQGFAMSTDEAIDYALVWLREQTQSQAKSLERGLNLGT
jgi:predicted ATPase